VDAWTLAASVDAGGVRRRRVWWMRGRWRRAWMRAAYADGVCGLDVDA